MTQKLNEHSSLADCEDVIEGALRAVIYAGNALRLIKEDIKKKTRK